MVQNIELIVGLGTFIIALATILWQLSATLTELRNERRQMSGEIDEMKKAIAELRTALERLGTIPVHEQRIAQLEKVVDQQQKQIAALWSKVFSVDRHLAVVRAVTQSQHDVNDTDRPPPNPEEEEE